MNSSVCYILSVKPTILRHLFSAWILWLGAYHKFLLWWWKQWVSPKCLRTIGLYIIISQNTVFLLFLACGYTGGQNSVSRLLTAWYVEILEGHNCAASANAHWHCGFRYRYNVECITFGTVVFAWCITSDFHDRNYRATERFWRNKIKWQHSFSELAEIQTTDSSTLQAVLCLKYFN